MWSDQSGDHSHNESHEPGRDDEERSDEEEKEIPPFEQLVDLSVLEPEPQVARSPLATCLAASHCPRYRRYRSVDGLQPENDEAFEIAHLADLDSAQLEEVGDDVIAQMVASDPELAALFGMDVDDGSVAKSLSDTPSLIESQTVSEEELQGGGGRKNTGGREYLLCNDYFSTMRAATDKPSSPVERVDQVGKGRLLK